VPRRLIINGAVLPHTSMRLHGVMLNWTQPQLYLLPSHTLQVSENKTARKTYGYKKDEINGQLKILHER
jgi:hypothetical protein